MNAQSASGNRTTSVRTWVAGWVSEMLRPLLLAAFAMVAGAQARADAGEPVPVHYVKLTGSIGANERHRAAMRIQYDACVKVARSRGIEPIPLPGGDLPPFVQTYVMETYYAAHRTLTLEEFVLRDVDGPRCEIKSFVSHQQKLSWFGAYCDVMLEKNIAYSSCDRESLDASKTAPLRPRPIPTMVGGEYRTVAGVRCRVFRSTLPGETCVAQLDAAQATDPFPFSESPLSHTLPGLLLQLRGILVLDATEVRLNTKVPSTLFDLPAGVKVKSLNGKP